MPRNTATNRTKRMKGREEERGKERGREGSGNADEWEEKK
jgi:hypothetical protein